MIHSSAIKLVATYAMIYWSAASFSHENQAGNPAGKHPGSSAVTAEKKDWGIAGAAKAVQRTITLRMSDDMRFTPAQLEVKQGETVRLVVKNKGKQLHELVIGSKQALEEHARRCSSSPAWNTTSRTWRT